MEIVKTWDFTDSQSITVNDRRYNVHAAIKLSEYLPVKDYLIEDLYIAYESPCDDNLRSFIEHMRMVVDADLSYPVLMNEDGFIIDGRHRLSKAILNKQKTIKGVRFMKDPCACYTVI